MRENIPQAEFFDGSGFEKHEHGQGEYFLAPSGRCYRVTHCGGWYITECAKDIIKAQNNDFQGIGLVDDDFTTDRILHDVSLFITENENDCDEMVSEEELRYLLYYADLAGLCRIPMMFPLDEYDPETDRILKSLKDFKRPPELMEIAFIVKDVFRKTLGEQDDRGVYHLAYGIKTGKVHPCPVCGKVYFWTPEEFDICPVCGWEDDHLQYIKPCYPGGANILSVRQAQLEFSLKEHEDTDIWLVNRKERFLDEYYKIFHQIKGDLDRDGHERLDKCRDQYVRDMIHQYYVEVWEHVLTEEDLKEKEEDLFNEIMEEE